MATPANDQGNDEMILRQLNDRYIHSDPNSDVAGFQEILAEDFTSTLPDMLFRSRQEFLDLIAQPRPFTDLSLEDLKVRFLSADIALLHGWITYTTKHDGVRREGLYTDVYQRRGGKWRCAAAEVVFRGE
jgi:hypothetical protein